jgi:hypothetical protein
MLIGEVILFGLLVSSSVQWVYYVYEGFRLTKLTALAHKWNCDRLQRLKVSFERLQNIEKRSDDQRTEFYKVYESLLDFPVTRRPDGSMVREAERATRLGNIIAVYELYPKTRYGVDSVLYWFHLLNLAPDNVRQDFSDQVSFAESLVLTSFSGALVAVLQALVLIGFGIRIWFHAPVVVTLWIGPLASLFLLGFGVVVWFLFYMFAMSAHRDAGKIFESGVDVAMPKFVLWLAQVQAPLEGIAAERLSKLTDYLKKPESG